MKGVHQEVEHVFRDPSDQGKSITENMIQEGNLDKFYNTR